MSILDELLSMPEDFEVAFQKLPMELRHWAPKSWHGIPGEKFSALEQACHLRDIEIDGYHDRFTRTLQEECPSLASLDGYALARERQYSTLDSIEVIDCFRRSRTQTVKFLKGLSDADLNRRAIYGAYGEVSLNGLIHLLRSHDLQHLACMHWLFARIYSK